MNFSIEILQYTEGNGTVPIFADIEVATSAETNYTLITVRLVNVYDDNYEMLGFGSPYGYTDESVSTQSPIFDFAWNDERTHFTVTGNFNETVCNLIMRSISFINSSPAPTMGTENATRYVKVVVTSAEGVETNPFTRSIHVHPVNSRPQITVTSNTTSINIASLHEGKFDINFLQFD